MVSVSGRARRGLYGRLSHLFGYAARDLLYRVLGRRLGGPLRVRGSAGYLIRDFPGVDLVGRLRWLVVLVQRTHAGTDCLVSSCNTFAGTQVIKPRLHQEGLVEVLRIDGVTVDAPTDRTVAESNTSKLMDCRGELRVIFERHAIFDRDADGAVSRLGVDCKLGRRVLPLIRRVVRKRALQDVESAREWKGDQQSTCRRSQRDRR